MKLSNPFYKKHILSVSQFSKNNIDLLFKLADEYQNDINKTIRQEESYKFWRTKVISLLFYQPSTRTFASFDSAIKKLGGNSVAIHSDNSSVKKGESLKDTIKTLSKLTDLIVIRHPEKGAAEEASIYSSVPVINAGDGVGEHPTQALLDLYTIYKKFGKIDGLNFTFIGDLKHSRTTHSLVKLLLKYNNISFDFINPNGLDLPKDIVKKIRNKKIEPYFFSNIQKESLNTSNIIYVSRLQKEYFHSEEDYLAYKGSYIINNKTLSSTKDDCILMHALPRVDEIADEVDDNPKAVYFDQVQNGLYIRMALLQLILG